jgi:hypothetical protein
MKICIIGPGFSEIPPVGWGAVEIVIWDTANTLKDLGHQVEIINTTDPQKILKTINQINPDFVHIHYDDYVFLYPYIQFPKAITTHYGYLERPEMYGAYSYKANGFSNIKPNVFALSNGIKNIYQNQMRIPEKNLYIVPNGVINDNFRFTDTPKFSNRSIYLAKVDYRKRQSLFQSISSIYYAGNIVDEGFVVNQNYLGEWSKENLYDNLTDYANLILLSDGEAHPLVCMEALSAGLGLVISEWAVANLDSNKDFITVIPESKIIDLEYISLKIEENRTISLQKRNKIVEYSKKFAWKKQIENYYIPAVNQVIRNYNG